MIVLSTPILHGFSFKIAEIFPLKLVKTSFVLVALIFPEMFADGAAIGLPKFFIKDSATGCIGTRIATVGSSAVTKLDKLSFVWVFL